MPLKVNAVYPESKELSRLTPHCCSHFHRCQRSCVTGFIGRNLAVLDRDTPSFSIYEECFALTAFSNKGNEMNRLRYFFSDRSLFSHYCIVFADERSIKTDAAGSRRIRSSSSRSAIPHGQPAAARAAVLMALTAKFSL